MSGWLMVWAPSVWRRRWPVLIALAALVTLVGGVATALAAGARRAETSTDRFIELTRAPNLLAKVRTNELELAPGEDLGARLSEHLEVVDELAALPGVESVRVESWWAISTDPQSAQPSRVSAFAIGTFLTAGEAPGMWVVDGALPGPDDPSSVIANEEAVRVLGAGLDAKMRFRTVSAARLADWAARDGEYSTADALDGPEITVTVAAVVRSEYDLGEGRAPQIYFPEGFARAHRDEIAHVEPNVYLRIDHSRMNGVRPAVERIVAPYDLDVVVPPSVVSTVDPSIGVEVTTLQIAALIATVGGALVMAIAFARQATAIRIDRTVGAALGLSRTQRARGIWLVLTPSAFVGSLGVPAVAWCLSGMFPQGVARLADPDRGLRADAPALLLGAVISLAVAMLIVVGSSLVSDTRVNGPAARHARPRRGFVGSPARLLGASFAVEPAGAGRRSRLVTAATLGAISLGAAAVVTVATLNSSRAHLARSPRLLGAPAALVYQSHGTFGMDDIVDATLATAGVEAVTRQMTLDEASVIATGSAGVADVSPAAYDTVRGGDLPPVVEGLYPDSADEVALGEATADSLGAKTGDTIRVLGARDEPELALQVTGILVAWGPDDPRHAFVVTPETLLHIVCPGASFGDCDDLTVSVFADAGTDAADATLREVGFADVPTPANVARLDQVGPVPWLLGLLLCLLAVGALLNDLLVALRWRRSDLAIARALGLTGEQAGNAFLWQALFIAVAGVATGVMVGLVAGQVVWRLIAGDLGVIADPIVPIVVAVSAAAIAVATATLLSIGPKWHAARLHVSTVLRSE